jgi:hypothetical protein
MGEALTGQRGEARLRAVLVRLRCRVMAAGGHENSPAGS